jgi:transposase
MAAERIQRGGLDPGREPGAAVFEPVGVGLSGASRHEVQQPRVNGAVLVAGVIHDPGDHPGSRRTGVGPDMFVDAERVHALQPTCVIYPPGVSAAGRPGGGDAPMFTHLMNQLKINRAGLGRPRTAQTLSAVTKAYSSRAIRTHLRDRGIVAVIPQRSDQIGRRKRRGSTGGRPPAFDKADYKGRNVVERNFNIFKQWRAWQRATTNSHSPTAAEPFSGQSASGWQL